jgi:LysR substrate binding domain.
MVPRLTTPFHAQHPNVRLTVLSQTSQQIQRAIDNFEIDIGVTYLDNEPLAHVRRSPSTGSAMLVTPARGRSAGAGGSPGPRRPACRCRC